MALVSATGSLAERTTSVMTREIRSTALSGEPAAGTTIGKYTALRGGAASAVSRTLSTTPTMAHPTAVPAARVGLTLAGVSLIE